MAKDINIHIKTPGAEQAKRSIGEVSQETKKVGSAAEEMGSRGQRGSKWFSDGIKGLVGGLGLAALAYKLADVSLRVAKFFDTIKTRSDEAVRNIQAVRGAFEELFEALGAYDEQSRERITKSTYQLLQKTAVPEQLGIPIVNAYTRQFKSVMPPDAFTAGLEGMLGYGARHGGEATSELIQIMAGWGMSGGREQGEFRRMVSEGAAASGSSDADMIAALSRGMPTIRAMGWSPQKAVSTVAALAAGEAGRRKTTLPAMTIESLGAPQAEAVKKHGLDEQLAEQPQQLLEALAVKAAGMDKEQSYRMLRDIYGASAAAGVAKLLAPGPAGLEGTIARAAGPSGAQAERAEEAARRGTLEARSAVAQARIRQIELDLTEEQKYAMEVRRIGEAEKQRFERSEPLLSARRFDNWFLSKLRQTERVKEREAFMLWWNQTEDANRKSVLGIEQGGPPLDRYIGAALWLTRLSQQQRFNQLNSGVTIVDHSVNYYPATDREGVGRPRVERNLP
ncbi:MAG: hypothetical protein WCZ89_02300 [Phycisphaerae bacterium]